MGGKNNAMVNIVPLLPGNHSVVSNQIQSNDAQTTTKFYKTDYNRESVAPHNSLVLVDRISGCYYDSPVSIRTHCLNPQSTTRTPACCQDPPE